MFWRPRCSAAAAQLFETKAKQAFMIDAETGTVLFSKDADKLIPPASLAKLMTMEVVFNAIKAGRTDAGRHVPGQRERLADGRRDVRRLDHVRRAEVGDPRSEDLIQGIIVQSANDGCIIIAEGMAGSEENFAKLMTERARALGLEKSVFKNSTGLPAEGQVVTVRELADARPAHLEGHIPTSTAIYCAAGIHLEQDHPAEPQSAAGDGHRRRRHEDRLHRGVRLRHRRLGQPRRQAACSRR